jgi:hypothetical protein
MEKYPEGFDPKTSHDLVESYSRSTSNDESVKTGHKFFSKQTVINYFPKYKLKTSGKHKQ